MSDKHLRDFKEVFWLAKSIFAIVGLVINGASSIPNNRREFDSERNTRLFKPSWLRFVFGTFSREYSVDCFVILSNY